MRLDPFIQSTAWQDAPAESWWRPTGQERDDGAIVYQNSSTKHRIWLFWEDEAYDLAVAKAQENGEDVTTFVRHTEICHRTLLASVS